MGQHSCCNQQKVKRGLWSPEEDEKLIRYITSHGYGCWSEVPEKAGLQRCGKSCRLRWINYLRPDIRRGRFTPEEERLIISLHGAVGNRYGSNFTFKKWAHIASHLPGRTDNEIKNYWNSWIKKKIRKPPATNKPCSDQHSQLGYTVNRADNFFNQDLVMTKPPFQDAMFSSSPNPNLFMFDTGNERAELFHEPVGLSSETWVMNQEHGQACPPMASFTTTMDSNYLSSLVENIEGMVTMEVQSCSVNNAGREMGLECLQRQEELNEWVIESQQCPSFLFWDHAEGSLGGDEIAPTSSNLGTILSSYPSSL
ncbi:unnamed protein product [Camellia sinensis]